MFHIYQHLICSVITSIACVTVLFQNYLCYCFFFLCIHSSNKRLLCSYGTNMSVLLKDYHILWLSWLHKWPLPVDCCWITRFDDETALHDSWSQLPYCAAVFILFPSIDRKDEFWFLSIYGNQQGSLYVHV